MKQRGEAVVNVRNLHTSITTPVRVAFIVQTSGRMAVYTSRIGSIFKGADTISSCVLSGGDRGGIGGISRRIGYPKIPIRPD
jgi:hypothetical protein